MALKDRGGYWHYRFTLAGETFESSTRLEATERNRRAAEKIEQNRRREVLTGESHQTRSVRFSDAWRLFLRSYEGEVKSSSLERLKVSSAPLVAFMGSGTLISKISSGDIEDYKAARRSNGLKEVTIQHDLHALSLLFQYARKKKWIDGDPLVGVRIPSDKDAIRDNILSDSQEKVYFTQALRFPILHDVGRLMMQQGLRPEEAQRIKKADVDLDGGFLFVRWGKSRSAKRKLSLTQESRIILGRRLAGDSQWIFPSPRAKGAPIGRLNKQHEHACSSSGVDCTLYDFRHTFATRLGQSGCDPYTLAAILGHSGLRCVMRYIHIGERHQRSAMQVFDEKQAHLTGKETRQ